MSTKLNRRTLKVNLGEARDSIKKILSGLDADESKLDAELEVCIQHAMTHLNIAWNARRIGDARYTKWLPMDSVNWESFPTGPEWKKYYRTKKTTVRLRRP
jgi:hypothetical protein